MIVTFDHSEGTFSKSGNCLLEVYCTPETEPAKYMFENGWLPWTDNRWYQCQSSRLILSPVSSRRRNELSKIKITQSGDFEGLISRASEFRCFNEKWLRFYASLPHYTFFMDDAAFGIVNFYEDQIFYTTLVWDKHIDLHSYGTLSYYHIIEKFRDQYEYLYTSEYYEDFAYKQNIQGFQYWDGKHWKSEKKYQG